MFTGLIDALSPSTSWLHACVCWYTRAMLLLYLYYISALCWSLWIFCMDNCDYVIPKNCSIFLIFCFCVCTGFWMIQRPCILMITFCGSCGIASHLLSDYKLLIVTLIHVQFFLVNGFHIYRFCVMFNWLPLFHMHVSLHHMDFKFELFIGTTSQFTIQLTFLESICKGLFRSFYLCFVPVQMSSFHNICVILLARYQHWMF